MTAENRRKGEKSTAQAEDSRESLVPLPNSGMVDKAERETSFLPSGQYDTYIAAMEGVVDDINIQEAVKAVIRMMIEGRDTRMRSLIFWVTHLEPGDQRIGGENTSSISHQQS